MEDVDYGDSLLQCTSEGDSPPAPQPPAHRFHTRVHFSPASNKIQEDRGL